MQRLLPTVICQLAVLWCAPLCAQETGQPTPAESTLAAPAAPVAPIEETKLPVYLKSKDGRWVPMLDWTFEDFERVYQENQGLKQRDQTPPYSLQSTTITGTVKGDNAELSIQFGILVRDDQWVRVPLRLSQAVLREGAKYEGPDGQCFLDFDAEGDGYIGRLHGSSGQQHRLTLNVLVPVTKVGEESRIKLSVPRTTSSSLKLTVPLAGAAGEVSTGAPLTTTAVGEKGTEFTVLGLGGDFDLSWRKAGSRLSQTEPVLEAVGTILTRVDSGSIHNDATLSVRAYGGPFDRFRVRLPEGAEYVPGNASDYTVVPVPANGAKATGAAKAGPLVEVRLAKKVAGPVEIRLSTKRRYETAGAAEWLELAGFEVVEAARQWGNIAITAAEDLQVVCTANRGVRQVDQLPEALRGEDRLAGFAYFSQPYSLTARVVPKKTRISVEPEYLLQVDEDKVRLEAKLKYTIRAAKVSALDVDLLDWELDEVGPANLVAVDMVAVDRTGVLSLPLATPSIGQIEITIRAHKRLATGGTSLSLALPRPQANSSGPAALVVQPADNIELIPDASATVGLVRQQVAPPMSIPTRQQAPLFYRGETAKAVFAAGMNIHPQSITVDVASQLTLAGQEKYVEQKLSYAIAYKPVETLTLEVPRSLASADGLEILFEGQPISPAELPDQAEAPGDTRPIKKRLLLPSPRIGSCELTIRYPIILEELLPETSIVSTVPLIMPADGQLESNKLWLTAAPGVRVQLREGPWAVAEESGLSPERLHGLQITANERVEKIVLGIHLEDRDALGSTLVERAWIQTWLSPAPSGMQRQDRAVFRFTSDQKELELQLPRDVELSGVELSLDRRRVQAKITTAGSLVIPLPDASRSSPHVLEANYHFPERPTEVSRWTMQLPRLGRNVWVRRLYWQLVLPQQIHLIAAPDGFTPEFTWGWTGAFWGRNPLLEQTQLESWVGAPHLTAVPNATSRYLFSTLGPVEQCELRVAGRSLIVLGASGIALIAGLLLLYVPLSRHPLPLLVVTLAFLSATFLYPEPTLLTSQAASLGLALTLVAGLLQRSMTRRRQRRLPRESASSLLEKGSTQALYSAPLSTPDAPTDTAPVMPPLSPPTSMP
ncbi:MAG: hypothetical protein ABFD16_23740 [Thermoguttaceae bacterium]